MRTSRKGYANVDLRDGRMGSVRPGEADAGVWILATRMSSPRHFYEEVAREFVRCGAGAIT